MGNSTIYDVRLRYQLEGQAERQLQGITRESMRAAQANRDLSSSLREVAALVGAGAAIAKGKELFVGYNAEIEQLRIRMAAMLEQSDLAKTFESATQQAGQLFQEFQKFAITSPVTTKELVEFSAGVAQAVAQAGQGTKAIANITEMGMTAAQAMGFEAHYAARELSEGLAGTANSRMLFLKQLVGSQKMTLEEFRKLDAQGRFDVLSKALNSDAMKQAAIAMGNSWKGVTSTLEDLIDINAAKAGEPLFRALKQELAGINDYLMSHQTEVAEWSQKVSDALIAGFGAVKDGIAFLVAHRELLLKLAEGWLALKVGGALGAGALGGAAGGAGGPGFAASLGLAFQGSSGAVARSQVQALKQAAPSIGQVIGGAMQGFMLSKFAGAEGWQADITAALGALGQLPGPIGAVSTALMGLKVGLDLLAKYVDENQQREIRSIETAESFSATFQRNQANVNDITSLLENRRALEQTLASGQFGEGQTGADYAAALATNRSAVSAAVIDEVTKARTEGLITPSAQFDVQKFHAMAAGFGWDPTKVALVTEDFTRAVEAMKIANPEFFKPKDKAEQVQQKKPAPVNVNIQRIEVSSRDPGRFVYGLAEIADKAVRAPTQARRARRGT